MGAVRAVDKLRGALAPDAEPGDTRTVSLAVLAELIADYDRATIPNAADRALVGPGEMLDRGYVMEANRRFFHPLGLALAVDRERVNADGSFPVQVWDYRDDPEGFFFADVSDDDARAKWLSVESELARKADRRTQVLGSMLCREPSHAVDQRIGSVLPPTEEAPDAG